MASDHPVTHPSIRKAEQLEFRWTDRVIDQKRPQYGIEEWGNSSSTSASADSNLAPPASESSGAAPFQYGPGHPWHYYPPGDNAAPVPINDIPSSSASARSMLDDLPKAAMKRLVKARELLDAERVELEQAAARYSSVVERGVEALSDYDRTIAYGGDLELARAGTIAILYNRISWHRGRINALEQACARGAIPQK